MTTLRKNLKAIAEATDYMDYPGGRNQFQVDSFEHYGLKDTLQNARAFDYAWQKGHAYGYAEVDTYFGDLVTILQTED